MLLRQSEYRGSATHAEAASLARRFRGADPDGYRAEFVRLIELAATAGARGALVDTADKRGPGLTTLWSENELTSWIARAHERGLFAAVAGKLDARDLADVVDCGADIVGVRGAACVGGRNGRVSGDLVQRLVERLSSRAFSEGSSVRSL